jgi:hypothetical protein
VNDRQGGALDDPHDVVDLQRVRQVIGEEHQQGETDKEQHDGDGDRESGELVAALAPGHPDGEQASGAVGEGTHEHPQHELVGPVAQEVTQQPGGELGRGHLQRDHRQTQQQRDHRHHRPGDADQQRSGVIGGALKGQHRARPDVDL